jgi:hypothetical protein
MVRYLMLLKTRRILMPNRALLLGVLLLAASQVVPAALLTQTLGDQDFADGVTITVGTFNGANAGDPAPFNIFNGSDVSGPNFSASWTFNGYGGPIALPVLSVTLTIGMYEHESAASGSQVASATINGLADITSTIDTAFEASPGASGQVRVYVISLPAGTFAQIATGSSTFALALQGPGLGVLGETPFNGAGIDFATLDIVTQDVIPEPAALSLFLVGFAGMAGLRYRRGKRSAGYPRYSINK